jgi:hypothetical protein
MWSPSSSHSPDPSPFHPKESGIPGKWRFIPQPLIQDLLIHSSQILHIFAVICVCHCDRKAMSFWQEVEMRRWVIGIGITVLAAGLGVGAAFGARELLKAYAPQIRQTILSKTDDSQTVESLPSHQGDRMPFGMGRGIGRMQSRGLQGGDNRMPNQVAPRGDRNSAAAITMDEAVQQAESLAVKIGSNVQVAEVMEFEKNFYAVLVEKDTGRGAVEILVDRYGRGTGLEPGPGMMWNFKYGPAMHRNASEATDNKLSLEEARQAAQDFLSARVSGATLNEGGYSFYGYYSFDYSVDGKTAGMLSVNGLTGEVWPHTWHGAFLSEKEMAK